MGCTALKYVYSKNLRTINSQCFQSCTNLTALVIGATTVCTLANANAFNGSAIASGKCYVYVTDTLVSSYKSASNWSTYAAQIKSISELPAEVKEELGL
jgi:hypothetical protein